MLPRLANYMQAEDVCMYMYAWFMFVTSTEITESINKL